MPQLDQPGVLGQFRQDVRRIPNEGHQRHHQLFTDRVNRGVCDLREQLFEVGEQQLGLFRKDGQGRIGPHRTHRLVRLGRHRFQKHLEVFPAVPEQALAGQQGFRFGDHRRHRLEQPLDRDLVFLHPPAIRLAAGHHRLDFLVLDHTLLLEIHQQHLAGPQGALLQHAGRRDIQHTGFGGHDDEVVAGNRVAGRAQTVPVQQGPHHRAIGERHRGRAIPRLHQPGMVFKEPLLVRANGILHAPRLGNQHHHRMRNRAPPGNQQFQGVVEAGGITAPGINDGGQLTDVPAKQRGLHSILAGPHLVQVPAQRVDFAVMGQETEWLGQFP